MFLDPETLTRTVFARDRRGMKGQGSAAKPEFALVTPMTDPTPQGNAEEADISENVVALGLE